VLISVVPAAIRADLKGFADRLLGPERRAALGTLAPAAAGQADAAVIDGAVTFGAGDVRIGLSLTDPSDPEIDD
jgi:hypothetical protein